MAELKSVLTEDDKRKILDKSALPYDPRIVAAMNAVEQATLENANKKQAFCLDTVSALLFRSLLSMQCALIEVYQSGDAKAAIVNWIETMIDSYGDDFEEHYSDVKISPDEYFKKIMESKSEQA